MTISKKLLIVASMALGLQALNISANCLLIPGSPCQINQNNNRTLNACPCSKNIRNQQRKPVIKRIRRVPTNTCPCKRSR